MLMQESLETINDKPHTNQVTIPWRKGTALSITRTLMQLMYPGQNTGGVWRSSTEAFLKASLKVIIHDRDTGKFKKDTTRFFRGIDQTTLLKYRDLKHIETVVWESSNISPKVIDDLKDYLMTLPGYELRNKFNQSAYCIRQHSYITMPITKYFNEISGAN